MLFFKPHNSQQIKPGNILASTVYHLCQVTQHFVSELELTWLLTSLALELVDHP